MYYGMPTLVELRNLEEHAKLAKELGLGFIEINMSFPEYTYGALDLDMAKEISETYGIFYTIHADEELNPFDFNKKISECYFDVMKDTLFVAKAIGARVINLHLKKGIYVTLPNKVILLTDVYHDEYISSVKRFIKLCEECIEDSGIIIAIENVDSNPFSRSQLEAIELFLKSPCFALTLDTGHEMKLDFADSSVFENHCDKLMHMHLHDCKDKNPHLPLGVGDVDILSKIKQLRGTTCLIEVKTVKGLIESVKYIKEGINND